MSRLILISCSVLVCLASASCVWGLASTIPNDRRFTDQPDRPAGLADLLNSPGRVGGYFVNACDYFTWEGDAEAVNAFLEKFAKIKGAPLTVVLREGTGQSLPKWLADGNRIRPADWQLSMLLRGWSLDAPGAAEKDKPQYTLIVDVWTGGQIQPEKIKVPAGLDVRYGAKLKLTIRCTKDGIEAGDEIPVEFTITNEGKSEYDYMDRSGDRSGRMEEYRLEAKDAEGRPVPDPRAKYTGGMGGGLSGQGKLAPGASFTKTIALNRWALLTAPGRYTVTGTYRLEGFSLDRGAAVASEPITITVGPRTPAEKTAYIEKLTKDLSVAKDSAEREGAVQKLMYTCDMRIVPALIESMYAEEGAGFWPVEAFSFYLTDKGQIKRQVIEAAKVRGLASSHMEYFLKWRAGVTAEEMAPVIERSLAPDNRERWHAGAAGAESFPDARYVPRLIAIATDPDTDAREIAMYALAWYRTDEGVAALRKLLADPDEKVRQMTDRAVRSGYQNREYGNLKNPLRDDDFPAEYRPKK